MKGSGSTYFAVVNWIVAVVPMLMDALSGPSVPVPKVSQPLSEPHATTGRPSLSPVSSAAFFVMVPMMAVGSTMSTILSAPASVR